MKKLLLILIGLFLSSQFSWGQVTTNSGSGLAATYTSLADAITALNAATITAPVVITLTAGNPQTAPLGGYAITAIGTALNTITFIGNSNSLTAYTPQTSGRLYDAVIKIIGGDYITIDGFIIRENAANTTTAAASNNMTEWGIALLYATTTNGAQNITIQNNDIALNRTYQNTFGIYSNSTHSATAPSTSATATTTAGGNSGLLIKGNSISNVNLGIVVVGPTAAADHNDGITIGGSSGNGNNVNDFGTTGTFSSYANVSGTVNGILVRNSKNFSISYNTVTSSNGGTTAGTLNGIQIPSSSSAPTGTFTNSINNNTFSLRSGIATGAMNGISVGTSTGSTTSTLNINNNDFNTFGHTVAGSGAITFISSGGGLLAATTNINSNTFTNITVNTTGNVTFITRSGNMPSGSTENVNSNSIVTAFSKTGSGGSVTLFSANASSVNGSSMSNNLNNFSNISIVGSTTFAGWSNTEGASSSSGPTKTITNNTFNNITSSTIPTGNFTGMNVNYSGAGSNISNNTITNFTGGGAITGINFGTSNGQTTHTISNNTITNLSTTGGAVTGITGGSTNIVTLNVNNNTIRSFSTTAALAVNGITMSAGAINNVFKNTISDLQSSNASGTVNGILVSSGTTINIYNNRIGDLRTPIANAANPLNGISITGGTTVNAYYNTVNLSGTSSGALFGSSAINASSTPALTLNNNVFVNTSASNGAGLTVAYRRSTSTLTTYGATSDWNDFAAAYLFYDGTDSKTTIGDYKTFVADRDANSINESPNFISTVSGNADFLKVNTTLPTSLESGGANVGSITDDFENDVRQGNPTYPVQINGGGTAPDMGADEFDGTPATPCAGTPATSIIEGADVCSGTGTTLTLDVIYTDLGITYQWKYATTSGGPYTNLGTNASQATGNLTETTYYVCDITCVNSSETFTTDEFTVIVKPVPTASASSDSPICDGATLNLTGTTDIGTTFAWTGPDSFTSSSQNPEILSATTAAAGTYSFIATLNGCSSTAGTTIVTVNPTPTAITITPASTTVSYATVQQLVAGGGILTGETILSEDFNGVTNDWTTINNSINGTPAEAAWTLRPNGYIYTGASPITFNSNDNSQFYLSNSDAQLSGSTTATILQSPAFSTLNFSDASINFYHHYRQMGTAKVEASTDGSAWTTLQTYSSSQGASGAFVNPSIALTAPFLNQATVFVRFKYDVSWGYYWAIDNVRITGTGPAPVTWTPTTDLYTDLAATIAYTGDARATVYSKPLVTRTYTATGTSDLGCTSSADVTLSVYPAVSFALTGPASVTAGSNSTDFTLQVYDVLNNPAVCSGNTCFTLTTTSTGQDAGFSNSAPCIAAGEGNTTFTYIDSKKGTFNLTSTFSSGDAGLTGQSEMAPITVNILPWLQANISAANGSTESFPAINAGTFEITATGISAPKVDVHNFVYQQLCGTGTVIARLSDLENGGWAGVEMRESNAPGAKTILIKTKLFSPSVQIGYRTVTNGNMSNLGQTIPSLKWMKIQRNGNTFTVYISYNGTAWVKRYGATISMANCINAGFFTENTKVNQFVTSTFDHAEVVNYLKSGEETELEVVNKDAFDIEFYPNPASGQITIVAPDNTSKIKVSIINASGMVVESDQFNTTYAIYNLQQLKPGVYLIRFEREGIIVNKRLVIF